MTPDWPTEPRRLEEHELEEFLLDVTSGRVFTSADLPSYNHADPERFTAEFVATWPFWGLALEAHGKPPASFMEQVGVFWSYWDHSASQRTVNGKTYPTFMESPRVLHRADWRAVSGYREQVAEAAQPEAALVQTRPGPSGPRVRSYEEIRALHDNLVAQREEWGPEPKAHEPAVAAELDTLEASITILRWAMGLIEDPAA